MVPSVAVFRFHALPYFFVESPRHEAPPHPHPSMHQWAVVTLITIWSEAALSRLAANSDLYLHSAENEAKPRNSAWSRRGPYRAQWAQLHQRQRDIINQREWKKYRRVLSAGEDARTHTHTSRASPLTSSLSQWNFNQQSLMEESTQTLLLCNCSLSPSLSPSTL